MTCSLVGIVPNRSIDYIADMIIATDNRPGSEHQNVMAIKHFCTLSVTKFWIYILNY